MRYHTFDLTISATGTPREYLLAAQSPQGEPSGRTKIAFDAAPLADWLKQLAEQTLSPQDLQALGTALYECLFVGEINLVFQRALGETLGRDDLGLRLRLRLNPPELAALPWEYLYSPERRLFLAASVETPVSRYLNLNKPVRRLAAPERVRMLVVIPQNTDLDTAAEYEMLQTIAGKLHDRLAVDFLPGLATTSAIRAALREKEYHVFHYAGHGAFKRAANTSKIVIPEESFLNAVHAIAQKDPFRMTDEAFLYLDHETKFTEAISAERFAHFFAEHASTRLAVLNACQGAARSAQQALAGLAPQLVFHDVPAVIAMQDRIANDEAILFATEFYEELCYDGQIETAISHARKALWQEKPNSVAFGNPVLYLRAEDGRLWEAKKTELPKPALEEKKPLLEHWQTWVALISAVVVLIGALSGLPKQLREFYENLPASLVSTEFCGRVVETSGAPLVGVEVIAQGKKGGGLTDKNGEFCFKVKEKSGTTIQILIMENGKELYNGRETLPGGNTITVVRDLP